MSSMKSDDFGASLPLNEAPFCFSSRLVFTSTNTCLVAVSVTASGVIVTSFGNALTTAGLSIFCAPKVFLSLSEMSAMS